MAPWHEHVMWWHVYPLGATGAPIRPDGRSGSEVGSRSGDVVHRLASLEPWLDHLVGLGLNGIALGPVFASSTHGYDTVDHFRIDPRLGDDDDFDHLVAAAHERGVRVLLDGVFNHVGRDHPAFAAVEQQGPSARTAGMFRIDWDGWEPGRPVRADVFEGHDQLVSLDHACPQVVDLVLDVMHHWLARGADGWRLDAAYAVPPHFWARVLPRVRHDFPQAWFTAEVIHGDYAEVVRDSTVDSVTQYELWQGIWHSIAERNLYELAHALGRHDALVHTFAPSTFVGNHDVSRIASAVGTDFVPHALAVLFTVAGIPSVYAGDEHAWLGVKEQRLGGDDAVRPALPAVPPGDAELDPAARTVLKAHRELIGFRRRNPWLLRAPTDIVHLANQQLVLRTAAREGSAIVALNLSDAPASVPAGGAARPDCGHATLADDVVELSPRGWAVLAGGSTSAA